VSINKHEPWVPEGLDFALMHGFIGNPEAASLPEIRAYMSPHVFDELGPLTLFHLGNAQRGFADWRHVNICSPAAPLAKETLMATLGRADVALLVAPGSTGISKLKLQEVQIAASARIPTIFLTLPGSRVGIPREIALEAFVVEDPFPADQTWYVTAGEEIERLCAAIVVAFKAAGDRQTAVLSFARPTGSQILQLQSGVGDLLTACAADPVLLLQTSSRDFEELVAELLGRSGYQDIELTSISRDGGRDVIAALNHALGRTVLYVECKRNSPDNPVGIEVVQRIVGVTQGEAHHGAVVTTSRFTKPAIEYAEPRSHILSLKDFTALQEWLRPHASFSR
jgi:hypothetical protein